MDSNEPVQYKELYIAGVGASAGGLEAIIELLNSFPSDIGNLTIIIAQHLSPTYTSRMVELISRKTSLEVIQAQAGIHIKSNKIYITPPNAHIHIHQGKVLLTKVSDEEGPKPSINAFFISLAEEKGEKAIGIILSGSDSDGTEGIKAIKQAGGLTISQASQTAQFQSMPDAAIKSGFVDLTAPPGEIWRKIQEKINGKPVAASQEIFLAYSQLREINEALLKKEKKLQESESNLKALLNNTLQSFILVNKDYKVIEFNEKAVSNKKLYLNKELKVGIAISDFIAPEIKANYIEKLQKCMQGEHVTVEYTFQSLSGQKLWFCYNFTPIKREGEIEAISISSLDITAEKSYSISYEKSENLITSVFNATETGICVTDHKGYYVKVNEGYAKIYGYTVDELIGKPFTIVVIPEQREYVEKMHADFIQGTTELPGEWKVQKKDGTLIDIYTSARLLTNPDGTRFKVTTVRDITETKKYKNLLAATQETVKVGGWEFDLITGELIWTDEVYKVYGYPVGSSIDMEKSLENYVDEARYAIKNALNEAITHGKPYDLELQFINQEGKLLWVRTTCKPIRVFNKTIKLYGTFHDITARKNIEQEIEKLSLVASKTSNGVIITDKNGKVEWVNEGFEKLSGYRLEEIVGKSPGSFFHGKEKDPATIESVYKQILKRENFSEDVFNYRKDGTPYWVNISFTPVFNLKNELTHYIAVETDITERKQKEEQLSFQATVLENVRDSVIVTDLEGKIIYWNKGAEVIFGYTKEEMLQQPLSLLHSGFDGHDFIKRHFAGKNSFATGNEWQGVRKNGQKVWINVKTNPMFDENGRITGIIGVSTDITAKKQAEDQLLNSEMSLKAMFDSSPNSHFLLNKDYSIKSYNKVAAEAIKRIWQKEVKVGDSMLDYSNPADTEAFKINFDKCIKGELLQFEKCINYPNGMEVWYEISYMPVYIKSGEVEAVSFSGMDITTRKRAEQRLRESNKTLVDFQYAITSASIVSMTDRKGTIIYVNDNFVEISKYSREELIGQNHRIINADHHPPEFFADLWKTISSGHIWRGEVKNKAKDGSYYWVDTFIIPFLNNKGKPSRYLSIRNDITIRKYAEEALIKQNSELEKANAELDRFVYSASHNLRAPLTSIMGLINIINTGEKSELYLPLIEKSVKKLDEFIKDIVNYSKNARLNVEVVEIDFEELIYSTVDDLRFMKNADNIQIKIDINKAYPFYSDLRRLKVVFGNILSNAFKYHNTSQPLPYVRVLVDLHPDSASISVEDNGIGIDKEHHDKLFSMFYRATTKSEGSGLGLYIVKEVIEKLGGSIKLQSESGKGTQIYLSLPNLHWVKKETQPIT